MGEIVKLIVTEPLLIRGQHVEAGEVLELQKEAAFDLLASGRVRRAAAEDEV